MTSPPHAVTQNKPTRMDQNFFMQSRFDRSRLIEIKLHLRRFFRARRGGKIWLLSKPKRSGIKNSRERFDGGIVSLNRLVESSALHTDAVLRTLQFRLQLHE